MTGGDGTWLYMIEASAGDLQRFHRSDDLAVVHYAASAADKTFPQAANGLLTALGKDEDVTGMQMHPSDGVNALPVWLLAHHTSAVVLSRVQSWQQSNIVLDLVRLLAATPCTVIVATDPGIQGDVADSLRGMTPTAISLADLPALLPPPTDNQEPAAPTHRPIVTPACDWPTFRYECRKTLSEPDFALIDSAYTAAVTNARKRLDQARPRKDSTRDLLTQIVVDSRDVATATSALRGTQAAYFEAGFSLRIDPARLIALHAYTRPVEFTDRDWYALRAYRDPTRPAVCTLHAHGYDITQIQQFTNADAIASLTDNRLNNQPLNPHSRAYLAANLLHRHVDGASESDNFIATKAVSAVLSAAGRDVGVLTAGKPVHTSRHTVANWKAGIGFLLQEIT